MLSSIVSSRHPDYSHTIEVLEQLLEYDRQKLWVPEQLIEHGLATLSQPTDYEWVIKQISRFYLGDFDKLAESALTSSTVKNWSSKWPLACAYWNWLHLEV